MPPTVSLRRSFMATPHPPLRVAARNPSMGGSYFNPSFGKSHVFAKYLKFLKSPVITMPGFDSASRLTTAFSGDAVLGVSGCLGTISRSRQSPQRCRRRGRPQIFSWHVVMSGWLVHTLCFLSIKQKAVIINCFNIGYFFHI